jgi:hypothetical protein
MGKRFFTERDIEDMASRGQMVLDVNDDVVLTELAYEKAGKLGVKINQVNETPPSAPVRPYLAQQSPSASSKPCNCGCESNDALVQRIKDAVRLKLGNQVDPMLLETIIIRVLNNIRLK